MCDFSLEAYKTTDALVGESYPLARFTSGSPGFAADEGCTTAACIKAGTKLLITGLSEAIQQKHGLQRGEEAIFAQREMPAYTTYGYRDCVRFANGAEVLLGELLDGSGGKVRAAILSLPGEVVSKPDDVKAEPEAPSAPAELATV